MLILGPIGFTAPWLLWALAALPVLWFLLRAVPPAPVRRRFPGVALLLGLRDETRQADRTPWWLLLLRAAAVALLILGFAGPVLNPRVKAPGQGPLLVLTDGSWADARDWPERSGRIAAALDEAGRSGRPAALVSLTDPPAGGIGFAAAAEVAGRLPALQPAAWEPSPETMSKVASALPEGRFETLWLSDGLDRPGRGALAAALMAHGPLTAIESPRPIVALGASELRDGRLVVPVLRAETGVAAGARVIARGLDPAGIERELARSEVSFAAGADRAEAGFDLPPELRNRVTRFEVAGTATAGAVNLADDALRRRKIAIVTAAAAHEGLELLAPDHYLRQALAPTADLIGGTVGDVIKAAPDVIILADIARVPETDALTDWVEQGGLLLRFAGPRLAASDIGRDTLDPLLPVRLRAGGRSVGGTMSWGEPRALAPFAEGSPFFGLAIPSEVSVSAQVLAQPGPELAGATIAALADGTPLVTRRRIMDGEVVLFHVAANAEWSNLALSGLFVQMLERLAVSGAAVRPDAVDLAGTTWVPEKVLNGFGTLADAGELSGVSGERLAVPTPGPELPPGLYAAEGRRLAVNAIAPGRSLLPAAWPAGVAVEGMVMAEEAPLKGWALSAAISLFLLDILATLLLGGQIPGARRRSGQPRESGPGVGPEAGAGPGRGAGRGPGRGSGRGQVAGAAAAGFLLLAALLPGGARAAEDEAAIVRAAGNVVLAYVKTGDAGVDQVSEAGLWGLSEVLFARTSIEPVEPRGVDPETDELAVFSFLYWPVTATEKAPSPVAYAKLNRYLRNGGMILFDTRDADVARYGSASPEGRRLQALAAPLDIPPLEPLPKDHVLTRSFYLLQDFPGRFAGAPVWVEAAPVDAEQVEGMPFRNLNDNVTPVVIGGNDWASAWAVDDQGRAMFPVGRGLAGERQRELSYRFGVNLIMHVLTGNYKSDQVHVPALLERLGQ
ncbi:MAG: DUF4159 domain-containing protein [Defluviimonas sp.]|uniref:DUF4159 domain-containing protein n=1 Tax=Albidovulum sp. TaxID=1872424 RepID=UPI001D72636D|nr:DUF4159 domain-containing protein [Paracoccaceae bacterium]MCC0064736.1 DUF4159 domain-containing protein [Defluviimonas sp.]